MRCPSGELVLHVLLVLSVSSCVDHATGPNHPPVAVAGADRRVSLADTIRMDASASYDPDGDAIVSWEWTLLAGTAGEASLLDADRPQASLNPAVAGVLLVGLRVSDGSLWSVRDVVRVDVVNAACGNDDDCLPCQYCNEEGRCQPVADGQDPRGDCNDGKFCNGEEVCDGHGGCRPGPDPCPAPLDCDENSRRCTACQNDEQCPPCQSCYTASATCLPQVAGDDLKNDCPDGPCLTGTCDGAGNCGFTGDGQACDDGNPCTLNDACHQGQCLGVPKSELPAPDGCDDGNPCSDDSCDLHDGSCQYADHVGPCDDGDPCTRDDSCQDGQCRGTDLATLPVAQGGCDDGNPCTDDTCRDGVCQNEFHTGPCDDGDPCTMNDACDDTGNCRGSDRTAIAESEGGCDDLNDCTDDGCDPATGQCTHQPNAATSCDDGAGCTQFDACQAGGACQGNPNDALCLGVDLDAVCLPGCSPDASGCVVEPDQLVLDCQDPGSVSGGAECTLETYHDGSLVDVGTGCLACSAEIGSTTVEFTDFSDENGDCSLDGWELVSGGSCSGDVTGCTLSGGEDCATGNWCNNYDFGQPVLRAEQSRLQGGNHEQLRLVKSFDTTGLARLTFCFDYAEVDATNDDGVLIFAYDDAHPLDYGHPLFCKNNGPRKSVDWFFLRHCLRLPDFANDNPALRILVILHSEHDDEFVFLDNLELFGWGGGCSAPRTTVFADDFENCNLPGWSNDYQGDYCWNDPRCPGDTQCDGAGNLWAEEKNWCIYTEGIDASTLDERVNLCVDLADDNIDNGEDYLSVGCFDDQGNWWDVLWLDSQFGPDNDCFTFCRDLSRLDPTFNNSPWLGIFIKAGTSEENEEIMIDNVVLSGFPFCPDEGAIAFGGTTRIESGRYRFTVSATSQLTAHLRCRWNDSGVVSNRVPVWFRPE